jgi:hypothetical protein
MVGLQSRAPQSPMPTLREEPAEDLLGALDPPTARPHQTQDLTVWGRYFVDVCCWPPHATQDASDGRCRPGWSFLLDQKTQEPGAHDARLPGQPSAVMSLSSVKEG